VFLHCLWQNEKQLSLSATQTHRTKRLISLTSNL